MNFTNVDGFATSNFISWAEDTNIHNITFNVTNGLEFFTNAANRLLGTQTNYIIPYPITGGKRIANYMTNLSTAYIPMRFPTNYYTPSVHRPCCRLAANGY